MICIFELSVQVRPKGKQLLDAIRVPITNLDIPAVYPRLFRLTKLYTCFLKNQRE